MRLRNIIIRERVVLLKLYNGPLLFRLHILQIVAREDIGPLLDLHKLSE